MIRTVSAALLAFTLSSFALVSPAHAEDAPSITDITTENSSGGLTPYVPLYTHAAITFTDSTPSNHSSYRVKVSGVGTFDAAYDSGSEGEFKALIVNDGMKHGETYDFTVQELTPEGEVASTSAAVPWTYRIVKHPRAFYTSSKMVKGQWSYIAGEAAKFRFRGKWESGTRFSTQVWVSERRGFSSRDFTVNTRRNGDLVSRYNAAKPVLSVKIPQRLAGKYVFVSIMGWKDGKAGWIFTVPAERVIRR